MSTQVCGGCTTRYAFGLAACPHCGDTAWEPSWAVDNGGGEQLSVGSSSSTSSKNTEPNSAPQPGSDQRRARTAASPSKPTGGSSTALPGTGDPIGGES